MDEQQNRLILILFPAELQNKHQQDQTRLTEKFHADQSVLKVNASTNIQVL